MGLGCISRAGRLAFQYEQCTISVAYGTISCKGKTPKVLYGFRVYVRRRKRNF